MGSVTFIVALLPTLIFSTITTSPTCSLIDDVSFMEISIACFNVTLGSASIQPDSSEDPESFFGIPTLGLQYTNGSVDNNTFKGFSQLKSLRAGSCKFDRLEPRLNTLEAFRLIDSEAKIESFEQISVNLQKLTIRNSTGFEFTSSTFSQLKKLRTLQLSYLNISRLPNGIFQDLKSLKILKIEEINLQKIEDGAFQGLSKLKELYLEDNNLEQLSGDIFKPLKRLRTLVISGKKLKALSLDMFTEQKQLNQLSWPTSTWRTVDVQRIHIMFPRLYSISHYNTEELEIKKKFRELNRILANRNI